VDDGQQLPPPKQVIHPSITAGMEGGFKIRGKKQNHLLVGLTSPDTINNLNMNIFGEDDNLPADNFWGVLGLIVLIGLGVLAYVWFW